VSVAISKDMMGMADIVAKRLKLIANPNRLMIACRLLEGEMAVGDLEIELGIRQPTLSRELGRLRQDGIITARRQSKVVFYSLTDEDIRRLIYAVHEATHGTTPLPPSA
jgi:DNA-binding transcriptional ArsR family regulator